MSGACKVLAESNCALVGGHTCEGPELSLGFCINGECKPDNVVHKGGMRLGEYIVLTKPVGTGTIFAAAMRSKARGEWVQNALDGMCQTNRKAGLILQSHGASCCTDVTGFGILGHLVEMTKASGVRVEIDLGKMPLLPGAAECVRQGIFSSLQPQNLRLKRGVVNEAEASGKYPEAYPLMFDPQVGRTSTSTSTPTCAFRLLLFHKRAGGLFWDRRSPALALLPLAHCHARCRCAALPRVRTRVRPLTAARGSCASTRRLPAACWRRCRRTRSRTAWPR